MKKFFKFVGSVTLLCATVAGGIFAYKKFLPLIPLRMIWRIPQMRMQRCPAGVMCR